MKKDEIIDIYASFYYPLLKKLSLVISVIAFIIIVLEFSIIIFDTKLFVVESNSMVPALEKGDLVLVDKRKQYFKDDIITFYLNDTKKENYTHRIIEVRTTEAGRFYLTKGDNNQSADGFNVTDNLVAGKVSNTWQDVGWAVLFLRSVPGIIIFMIIPATILVTLNISDLMSWLRRRYKAATKRKQLI